MSAPNIMNLWDKIYFKEANNTCYNKRMSFVSYSPEHIAKNSTAVSNTFIDEHLPNMNGDCLRVYLYGLYLCSAATRYDNTIEHFATTLGLAQDDVVSAFTHLAELGLVQVLTLSPVQVKYLPVKSGLSRLKKIPKGKYEEFFANMQAVLECRMITPSEYEDYVSIIESLHIEPSAFVLIAKYCVEYKKECVGRSYIEAVAKRWAYNNVRTFEAVKQHIDGMMGETAAVVKILKALGSKRSPEPEDFELYKKWKGGLGYSDEIIVTVAKKSKGTMARLDARLLSYYELKLFELNEIENFETRKKELTNLARAINKKIGAYYEDVTNIVETYISVWLLKGFDEATLLDIADFCFKGGKKTLEKMNEVVEKFYDMGVLNPTALRSFVDEKIGEDKELKTILEKLNLTRAPNQMDKDFYKKWKTLWGFNDEIIYHAITLSADKERPLVYMNRVLGNWHEKGAKTLEKARESVYEGAPPQKQLPKKSKSMGFKDYAWDEKELNRVLSSLDIEKF